MAKPMRRRAGLAKTKRSKKACGPVGIFDMQVFKQALQIRQIPAKQPITQFGTGSA
jgi:hypothetical protein